MYVRMQGMLHLITAISVAIWENRFESLRIGTELRNDLKGI